MPDDKKPSDGGEAGDANGGAEDDKKVVQPEAKKLDLTQEDLDRIIADRVRRAQPADYEALKAKAAKQDAAEAAEKSDTQKAKDAQAEAERKAAERTSKADAKLRRAAILAEAVAQNAADSDIVIALLAGDDGITVGDDGEVSGVKDAVKKLLKDKPVLVKGKTPGASGGEFGGNDQKTLPERIRELEAAGKYGEARDLKIQQGLAATK